MSSFFDSLYAKPKELSFVKPKGFDVFLCPSELLSWLKKANEIGEDEAKGDYHIAVSSMCEYSCLWVCGKLKEKYEKGQLKGELYVCYGKFGFWEHYWIGYKLNGVEYFLDLTLAQFRKESPRFSVVVGEASEGVAEYNGTDRIPFDEFFGNRKRDWDIIESGKALSLGDFASALGGSVDKLRNALDDL